MFSLEDCSKAAFHKAMSQNWHRRQILSLHDNLWKRLLPSQVPPRDLKLRHDALWQAIVATR